MSNLIFIDVETTSLGENAAVIEIAAIAYKDGERMSSFQSYIRPHIGSTLDPRAFEINKIDVKAIWDFPEAKDVIKSFLEYVDSFECVFSISGHNVQFDKNKLFKLFCRNGEYGSFLNRFRPGGVCTLKLARDNFNGKREKPKSNSLVDLCEFYKIDLKNAHSALPDISATIDVYEKLIPLIETSDQKLIESLDYQSMKRKYMSMRYVQINPEGDYFVTREATLNPVIHRFIMNELYELYCTDGYDEAM